MKELDKKIEIMIATHKKANMPNYNIYLPIHVGKENKKELGYIGDNTGKNISLKNPNYCELTALYWYLKNRINKNIEYIGLNHYRRYFIENNNKFSNSSIVRMSFSEFEKISKNYEKYFLDILKEKDVILPKKRIYPISIKAQYATMHVKEHINETIKIIGEIYPEYVKDAIEYLNGNKSWLYNMFIIKKEYYIGLMEFIFNILFELEKRIIIPEDSQQARVFGFLSERLLNIYVLHNKLKVKELPVAFLHDGEIELDNYIRAKRNSDIIFKFGNKIWNYMFFTKNIKVKRSKSKK